MANPVELVGGIAIGTGVGAAVGATVTPKLQDYLNDQWTKYPHKPPTVGTLASGVAQGQVPYDDALAWARSTGFDKPQFDALVSIANTGPGVPVAFELWRRGKIGEAGFRRAAKRQGLEQEWIDRLVEVFHTVLDPADLARGIHRGLVPDPGLLRGELPSGVGNVPAYPVYGIDALAEALAAGFDKDHLGVLVGLQGNPMGAHEAAEARFRSILTRDDYLRAIAEGNTRNEWADAIFEQSRQIPTAREFLENALRGYRTLPVAIQGAALHGMTPEHATMIYQNQGRPMTVRHITQALARGGKFKPEPGEITDPYDAAIVEGSLKPAYYDLEKAMRYTYPSAFVIRALAEGGDLGDTTAVENILLDIGWPPFLAAKVAPRWAPKGAATDPYVKKAQTQLWTTTHTSYKAQEIDDATTQGAFNLLGIPADAQSRILDLWGYERGLRRAQLSPADVRKAWQQGDINDATKQAWTQDEARAALIDRGWSVEQANDYMNIPYKG